MIKKMVKKILPPIIADLFKKRSLYGFFGNYESWGDALRDSHGYDNPNILEKVTKATLKVKSGEAVFERDSVTFDTAEYSWPVVASLLWSGSRNENTLTVLDFGGSLGSSYFQNKNFLSHFKLEWNVVEQENFVATGKKLFEDSELKFHTNKERENLKHAHLLLVSSVIQYLEDPYDHLEKLLALSIPIIVFDRTTFLKNEDRLTVQKVRPGIYDASYPAWFLNEEKFLKRMGEKYALVSEFTSLRDKIELDDTVALEKGFIFKLK